MEGAHRPLGWEVVAADEAERLAELCAHQRRRAEHQGRDELLDQLLRNGNAQHMSDLHAGQAA
jgi:hypothetical protein